MVLQFWKYGGICRWNYKRYKWRFLPRYCHQISGSYVDSVGILSGISGQKIWSFGRYDVSVYLRNDFLGCSTGNTDTDPGMEFMLSSSDSLWLVDAGSGNIEWRAATSLFGEFTTFSDINGDGRSEIFFNDSSIIRCVGITTSALDGRADEPLPAQIELGQNYPNPFNALTQINYRLSELANPRLEIFNNLGQRVTLFNEGTRYPGEHSVTWDAAGQASGVYFYRLDAGKVSETKRMTLIK